MTGRERLVAAARGGEVDRVPILLWGSWDERADGCVIASDDLKIAENTASLVIVNSPLTRALRSGIDLNTLLSQDPEQGNSVLDQMVKETESEMEAALSTGADGVAYVIDGAYPGASTPMQYGGYYLERDRALLEQFDSARFNLIFVEGTEEVYLDSVSDLAGDALGWRVSETGFSFEMMRALRSSAFAAFEPSADIRLIGSVAELESVLATTTPQEVSV